MTAIDKMRDEGLSVGLVKIRLWRPFPDEEFKAAVAGASKLAVIDRCITFGSHANSGLPGGPFPSV